MAAAHPGKWKPVFITPLSGQQPDVVQHTQQIAAHACLICTNLQQQKWKVLYTNAYTPEGPNNKVQTRIWDPLTNKITSQDIPDWPPPSLEEPAEDPPRLFCGGHTFMSNGELLMAGGIRQPALNAPTEPPHPPASGITGLNYTYIFNPNPPIPGQEWRVAEGPTGSHAMADGRFYPTLTHLGITPFGFSGKVVVMSG